MRSLGSNFLGLGFIGGSGFIIRFVIVLVLAGIVEIVGVLGVGLEYVGFAGR